MHAPAAPCPARRRRLLAVANGTITGATATAGSVDLPPVLGATS